MNWLAHIYLAKDSREDILGNFLGDFLANVQWQTIYSKAVQKGIQTHFAVDKFATLHPIFIRSCQRLSEKSKDYAAILIDMFYDHFLARSWDDYSSIPLDDFVARFYTVLSDFKPILPDKLLKILPALTTENWLVSYQSTNGITKALVRLAKRMNHPPGLTDGVYELTDHYADLESDFRLIMDALHEFIKPFKGN